MSTKRAPRKGSGKPKTSTSKTTASPASKKGKKPIIHVRGDVSIDWLLTEEPPYQEDVRDYAPTDPMDNWNTEGVDMLPVHGGAWFLANAIRAAMRATSPEVGEDGRILLECGFVVPLRLRKGRWEIAVKAPDNIYTQLTIIGTNRRLTVRKAGVSLRVKFDRTGYVVGIESTTFEEEVRKFREAGITEPIDLEVDFKEVTSIEQVEIEAPGAGKHPAVGDRCCRISYAGIGKHTLGPSGMSGETLREVYSESRQRGPEAGHRKELQIEYGSFALSPHNQHESSLAISDGSGVEQRLALRSWSVAGLCLKGRGVSGSATGSGVLLKTWAFWERIPPVEVRSEKVGKVIDYCDSTRPGNIEAKVRSYNNRSGFRFRNLPGIIHSVWDLSKFPGDMDSNDRDVFRLRKLRAYSYLKGHSPEVRLLYLDRKTAEPLDNEVPNLLVLNDADLAFRDRIARAREREMCLAATKPYTIVLLARRLPNFDETKGGFTDDLWERLYDRKERTAVVVSMDLLRESGAAISRRVSWDRTLEDFGRVLAAGSHLVLNKLAEFDHFIIRLGVTGAIHCYHDGSDKTCIDFYYDPFAKGGVFRDQESQGSLVGCKSIFVANIVRGAIAEVTTGKPTSLSKKTIGEALAEAIPSCQRMYARGLGKTNIDLKTMRQKSWVHPEVFDKDDRVPYSTERNFPYIAVAPKILTSDQWERGAAQVSVNLLDTTVGSQPTTAGLEDYEGDELADVERLAMGIAIVRYGIKRVLNHEGSSWSAPVATFGGLTLVGREDIERYQPVRNRIKDYLSSSETRPLSIAVFGAPGGGKSFGVKQIVRSIAGAAVTSMGFNVAQFRNKEDLDTALLEVSDVNSVGKIPLVFFDEFDTRFGADTLGWLRYFLEPMEDGRFRYRGGALNLGRAIFVFAGGTAATFSEFEEGLCYTDELIKKIDGDAPGPVEVAVQRALGLFKHPDFSSRLNGHINIAGVNHGEFAKTAGEGEEEDKNLWRQVPIIRRAVVLRSMIEERNLVDPDRNAKVDTDVISAMLQVSRFKHGPRSMGMILDGAGQFRERIEKAGLAISTQLDMHTVAREFNDCLGGRDGIRRTREALSVMKTRLPLEKIPVAGAE